MSDNLPLFSILESRLGYLSQRQKLIAENVANADTPGYTPHDLKPFTLPSSTGSKGGALAMAPVQTNSAHLSGSTSGGSKAGGGMAQSWQPQAAADSETRVDGNKVVLEDEMMKMTDARMNYDAAVSFYQQANGLLQLALRTPGRGA